MVAFATAALILAAAAQANPIYERIYKRQDLSSAASVLSASASELVSSAIGSASALPSSAAGSASASASSSAGMMYPAYPCPQGLLTYVETMQAYPGVSLESAVGYLSNWAQGVPFPIVASSGSNETGATRTYTVSGLDISDVLVNQTIDPMTGGLMSDWNTTSPVSAGGVTIYQAANHLSYYSNTTNGESTAVIYSNFCTSDQAAGSAAYTQLLSGVLAAYGAALSASAAASSGVASSGMMMSSAASSMMSSASAIPSAASSAAGSAAGLLSSATGAVASATGALASLTSVL